MAKHSSRRRKRRNTFGHTLARLAKRAALAVLSDVVITVVHVLVDHYVPPVLPGA
jgi:hypothetical protein